MKKVTTIAAAALLLSSTAFAGTQTVYRDSHVVTDSFDSKTQALNAAFDLVDHYKQLTPFQLKLKLPTFGDSMVKGVELDDTTVKVEEFAESRGNTQYRAVIDLNYHYQSHESNS
jgi:uncharacterized GH25 family protein